MKMVAVGQAQATGSSPKALVGAESVNAKDCRIEGRLGDGQ